MSSQNDKLPQIPSEAGKKAPAASATPSASGQSLEKKLEAGKKRKARLYARITKLRTQNAGFKVQNTELNDEIADRKNAIADLQKRGADLQTRIDKTTANESTNIEPTSEPASKGQERATDIEALNAQIRALRADNEELKNYVRDTSEDKESRLQEIQELFFWLKMLEAEKVRLCDQFARANAVNHDLSEGEKELKTTIEDLQKRDTDMLAEKKKTSKRLRIQNMFCQNFIVWGKEFVGKLSETAEEHRKLVEEQVDQISSDDDADDDVALEQQLSNLSVREAEKTLADSKESPQGFIGEVRNVPTDPAAESSGSKSKAKGQSKLKSLQAVNETGPIQEGAVQPKPKAISSPKQRETPELSPKSKEKSQTVSKAEAAHTKPRELQGAGQSEVVAASKVAFNDQQTRAPSSTDQTATREVKALARDAVSSLDKRADAPSASPQKLELEEQIKNLSGEKSKMRNQIEDLQGKLQSCRDENEHYQAEIEKLSQTVDGYLRSSKPNRHHLHKLKNALRQILSRKSAA